MGTSAIPAALDGLITLCRAQAVPGGALDKVIVFDGPPLGDPSDQLMLFLGDTPEDEQSVTGQQQFAQLGGSARDERISIYCTAVARSGDTDMRAERQRVFAILGAVENLLRPGLPGADPTLGGAALYSQLATDLVLSQFRTSGGALAKLGFTVEARARI
jgi:hypothetical protein